MDPDPYLFLSILLSDNTSIITSVILLIVLLICSALISGAEVSLFSLTRFDIDQNIEKEPVKMPMINGLLEKPKKLLATILVANNFINIAIVLLFAYLGEYFFSTITNHWIRFSIEVVLATFLILLFGEIIPKVYASRNKVRFSLIMAKPLHFLNVFFSPLNMPMRWITLVMENRLGKQKSNLSVDQLSQALELTNADETTEEEQKILEGIVSFGNTDTKQVMRPRMDIFALDVEQTYEQIIPEIVKNGYSRIPVFKENVDNIVGVLYTKDLLPFINTLDLIWQELLRDPFYVPENKKLDDLMVEFQTKKVHLAIVVDEYGGTSGIISLEDVIEEIVGDISDEFDDDDLFYTKLDNNNYSFEGKTQLKDFYKIVELEDESVFEAKKGEAERIAGFVLEISGSFPRVGSKINFKNYVFTIEAIEKKRIKQLKFTILP